MLKHHDTIKDRDALLERPESTESLPQLPEDVVVPDDLSGLDHLTDRHPAVRWLGWTAALAVVVGGSVYLATQLGDDTPDEAPAQTELTATRTQQFPDVRTYDGATVGTQQFPDVRNYDGATVGTQQFPDVRNYATTGDTTIQVDALEPQASSQFPDVRGYYVALEEARIDAEQELIDEATAQIASWPEVREYYISLEQAQLEADALEQELIDDAMTQIASWPDVRDYYADLNTAPVNG